MTALHVGDRCLTGDAAQRAHGLVDAERANEQHDFASGHCEHWRCLEANGWQCAECGHYFPREAVRMDADSEVRCRGGMGHERAVERAVTGRNPR
jgi:hypothetical protein